MTRQPRALPDDPNDLLRQLYQEDLDRLAAAGDHPSEDDWLALAADTLPEGKRDALADHVVGCAECAAIHRALTELRREAAAIDPRVPALAEPGGASVPWRGPALLAAAALLIAVMGGGALWWRAAHGGARAPETATAAHAPERSPAQGAPVAPPASTYPPWASTVVAVDVRLPAALVVTLRGSAPTPARGDLVARLRPALDLYRAGDYANAGPALAAIVPLHPEIPEVAFYAGLSLLLSGDATASVPLLEAARASDLVGGDARWFLAVAHERHGDHTRAIATLAELCAGGGPRGAEACGIASGGASPPPPGSRPR